MTDADRRLVDLVDDRIADSLEAMALPPPISIQVGYLLRNCRLRSAAAIAAIPARSVTEFTEWFRRNKRFRLSPEPKPEVFSMAMRTISILACRLRLNSGSALGSTGHRVLPALPVTARARRELLPKRRRVRPVSRSTTLTRSRVYAKRIVAARVAPLRVNTAHSTARIKRRHSVLSRRHIRKRESLESRGSAIVTAGGPKVQQKRPTYIPRKLFLASRGDPQQAKPSERDPRDCLTLRTIFSPPLGR